MNQQAISKLSALLLGMMLFNPACLAAQTNTAPSAQPLSEALEPAENSAQLTDKGYSSYQRALLYASFETPEGDLAAQNELNNAENLFRQAAEKNRSNLRALNLLGEVFALSAKPRKAIGAFNFALQINPKYYPAWLARARVLLAMGLLNDVKMSYLVLARNEPAMAAELMAAIDDWIAQRENPLPEATLLESGLLKDQLTEAETAFIEWRLAQDV